MDTSLPDDPKFNKYYEKHGKFLRLKGLRPKTIEAYSRTIRRIGNYFDARTDYLTSDLWCIYSRFPWHNSHISFSIFNETHKIIGCPHYSYIMTPIIPRKHMIQNAEILYFRKRQLNPTSCPFAAAAVAIRKYTVVSINR